MVNDIAFPPFWSIPNSFLQLLLKFTHFLQKT